ncbi:MAG: glycosyltransferase family 10 [Bacteroidota bacterium]
MVVNVVRNYGFPDFFRQSPDGKGVWENVTFVLDSNRDHDLLICLNPPNKKIFTRIPKENRWLLTQEPPPIIDAQNQISVFDYFGKIFTQKNLANCENIQTALPWHVNMNFDELCHQNVPSKRYEISTITSNLDTYEGQKTRIEFLNYLEKSGVAFNRYGKGVNYLRYKEKGLSPFKYSICIENSFYPNYWTEKIADSFLCYTMPIYAGCPNIADYFPSRSMILIDLNDFEKSKDLILKSIKDQVWEKNLDAIVQARELVLFKYQFYPWMVSLIKKHFSGQTKKLDRPEIIPATKIVKGGMKARAKFYAKKIKKTFFYHLHS